MSPFSAVEILSTGEFFLPQPVNNVPFIQYIYLYLWAHGQPLKLSPGLNL